MKLRHALAATALAVTALGANATAATSVGPNTWTFGGFVSDTFTFTSVAGDAVGSALAINFPMWPSTLSISSITLDGSASNWVSNGTGFNFSGPIAAGAHTLAVNTTGSGFYYGSIAVTPVPEPEVVGMLALGLGVLGFVARRRKSA